MSILTRRGVTAGLPSIKPVSVESEYTLTMPASISSIAAVDANYLWVGAGVNEGFNQSWKVVDWSDPTNLSVAATFAIPGSEEALTGADILEGRWALATATSNFTSVIRGRVVDLATPTAPVQAGQTSTTSSLSSTAKFLDSSYYAWDHTYGNAYLQIMDWSDVYNETGTSITVASSPTLVGGGGLLNVSPDTNNVSYVVNTGLLRWYDVSARTSISSVYDLDISAYAWEYSHAWINDTYIAVVAGTDGLLIVEASGGVLTLDNQLTGFHDNVKGVQVKPDGNRLFVSYANGGMGIVDVSTPTAPSILGESTTGAALDGSHRGEAYVDGKIAWYSGADVVVWTLS